MSKLIYRESNGNWGVKGVSWAEIPDGLYGALYKLMDYEDICSSPSVLQCYMDDDLGPVRYRLIDEAHSVWQCERCGHITQFEADGPTENGWHVCPSCVSMITPEPEGEEDEPC